MTQVIETEHLERCPFCGGEAELRVADHALRDEANKKAASAWNRRPNAEILEQEREAYIRTLPRVRISSMLEAVELSKYAKMKELFFCNDMARLYGCRPLKADGDNLRDFLVTLFHYGKIQGIRQERARKRRRQQAGHEAAKIARVLTENPLLYQVMKTAVEVQSVEAIKQATDFLKGAKKNED